MKTPRKILGKNKKAYFDYTIQKEFQAGLVLDGWEVKSIKLNNFSLKESYVSQFKNEIWIYGMHISKWKQGGNAADMNEIRPKKLLLNSREVRYLIEQEKRAGLTIVPLNVHLSKSRIKIQIALGKGKQKADKRSAIKEKEQKREINRDLRKMGY